MFKQYIRTNIAEMRPYTTGEDSSLMSGVSVSDEDHLAGSPKLGDFIARNPQNYKDQWLVAAEYFKQNFKEL